MNFNLRAFNHPKSWVSFLEAWNLSPTVYFQIIWIRSSSRMQALPSLPWVKNFRFAHLARVLPALSSMKDKRLKAVWMREKFCLKLNWVERSSIPVSNLRNNTQNALIKFNIALITGKFSNQFDQELNLATSNAAPLKIGLTVKNKPCKEFSRTFEHLQMKQKPFIWHTQGCFPL